MPVVRHVCFVFFYPTLYWFQSLDPGHKPNQTVLKAQQLVST